MAMGESIPSALKLPLKTVEDILSSHLKLASTDTKTIHGFSLRMGFLCSTFLCNNLLNAYVARAMIADARKLFDGIPNPNVVTWSAMISGYTHTGSLKDAIVLFRELQSDRISCPNEFTFGSILKGCARAQDSRIGMQIHCSVSKFGFELDGFISNSLIDMYANCGRVEESRKIFDQSPNQDVVSWTTMLTCLANSGLPRSAFELFRGMIRRGVRPAIMTFASLVKVFDEPAMLNQAKQVQGFIVKLGIEIDDQLGSALISMYGRCGGVGEASRISVRMNHDSVSWTSMLVAFVKNGYNAEAIHVLRTMISAKATIDPIVISSVIAACSEELEKGREIHGYAVRNSLMILDASVGNALITLYGRCGEITKAEIVFRAMNDKDAISWTAMLTSYGHNRCSEEALELFRNILRQGFAPPIFSVTGAIRSCSMIARLLTGKQMHSMAVKMGIDDHLSIQNSLVTMYAKCGCIEIASRVFHTMAERDLVSWNALITGFSQHGFEKEALELFTHMQEAGIKPDGYTFAGILISCSRTGLVSDGCEYFRSMNATYGLEPKMEHYAIMVDLFGRAGKLCEAIEFIHNMPCDPDFLM